MFEKGHTLSKGPRKPGGGAKKSIKGKIRDFLAEDRQNIGKYLKSIRDIGNDVAQPANIRLDALKYLSDRHLGRPHQSLDARVKGEVLLTADDYALIALAKIEELKQLEQIKEIPLITETSG